MMMWPTYVMLSVIIALLLANMSSPQSSTVTPSTGAGWEARLVSDEGLTTRWCPMVHVDTWSVEDGVVLQVQSHLPLDFDAHLLGFEVRFDGVDVDGGRLDAGGIDVKRCDDFELTVEIRMTRLSPVEVPYE